MHASIDDDRHVHAATWTLADTGMRRYGAAIVMVGLAVFARWLLQPLLGFNLPFITLFAALFVCAWRFGFWPTIAALAVSAIAAQLLFVPPLAEGQQAAVALNAIGLALYLGVGLGAALMGEGRLRAHRRAKVETEEAHQARMLAENAAIEAEEAAVQAEEQVERADQEASRAVEAIGIATAAQAQLAWQAGLLEQSHDAILVWELGGPVRYWSRGAESLYGWSREEVIGKRSHDLLRSSLGSAASMDAVETRLATAGEWSGEVRHRGRDERTIVVESRLVALPEIDGKRLVLETNRDITENKRIEEQLIHAQQMDAIGQLAGGVAHDFNNLLTAISGYAAILLDDLGPTDPRRSDAVGIQEAVERATALTRQLLAFSRKQVMAPVDVDVREVLDDTGRMLRRLISEDIDLAIVSPNDVGRVRVDPGQLSQVLVNLAVNARDAMPDGGRLTIEAREASLSEEYADTHLGISAGRFLRIAVSDTGCGMSPEVKARMFEPFYTTKERGKGTGLGLSTVFGIVKQLGGHVFVYSEEGHGTTVKVYLPRVEGAATAPLVLQPVADAPGTETILVLEDDDAIRMVARRALEKRGYRVIDAGTPAVALDLAARYAKRIHLLLTDVVLPEMSGRQVAGLLLAKRPDMVVLYMSGYTDDGVAHHGRLARDAAFLQKPFTPATLVRRIREELDAHRTRAVADLPPRTRGGSRGSAMPDEASPLPGA